MVNVWSQSDRGGKTHFIGQVSEVLVHWGN